MIRALTRFVVCWWILGPVSTANASFRIVARTGQMAPVPQESTIQSFSSPPSLNEFGHVAFASNDLAPTGATTSLWTEGSGFLVRVLRSGDATPGIVNGRFRSFHQLVLNDA